MEGQSDERRPPGIDTAPPSLADQHVRDLVAVLEASGAGVDGDGAAAWLTAATGLLSTPGEFAVAESDGIGGHELALLDFDAAALGRLRLLGQIIGTPAAAEVRAALAIAGSAAQNRIQPFPADLDFFERVHIAAGTRAEAQCRLAAVVRDCVLRLSANASFRFDDVYFGRVESGPSGGGVRSPTPRSWSLADVRAGTVRDADGRLNRWQQAAADPGFVKLSWFVADRALGGPVWVSKVIDATWQRPDGTVVSLDGELDPDYQQIYLDAGAAALARNLVDRLTDADRARYLRAMEREIVAHSRAQPANFGKVAKRLYNLCRATGRYREALYLRELFDEPEALLYQLRTSIAALRIEAEDDLHRARVELMGLIDDTEAVLGDDDAGRAAIVACRVDGTGATATSVLDALARLEAALSALASERFRRRLTAYPPVAELLGGLAARYPHG